MLKQYLSIFFLSLSTLMMLGHSIVPHHHHGHVEFPDFQEQLPHIVHDSDRQDRHLNHVLFNIHQGQKGVECISCPNIDENFNNENFTFLAIVPTNIGLNFPLSLCQKFFFDYQDSLFISNYFPPGGLRAPPFFT